MKKDYKYWLINGDWGLGQIAIPNPHFFTLLKKN